MPPFPILDCDIQISHTISIRISVKLIFQICLMFSVPFWIHHAQCSHNNLARRIFFLWSTLVKAVLAEHQVGRLASFLVLLWPRDGCCAHGCWFHSCCLNLEWWYWFKGVAAGLCPLSTELQLLWSSNKGKKAAKFFATEGNTEYLQYHVGYSNESR